MRTHNHPYSSENSKYDDNFPGSWLCRLRIFTLESGGGWHALHFSVERYSACLLRCHLNRELACVRSMEGEQETLGLNVWSQIHQVVLGLTLSPCLSALGKCTQLIYVYVLPCFPPNGNSKQFATSFSCPLF